jgi:multisubunit Na+/H+ antiporter MnhE subunit
VFPRPTDTPAAGDYSSAGLPGALTGYPRAVETLTWWVVLVLVWVASLTTVSVRELVVAAVVAVPCALTAARARRALASDPRVSVRWLRGVVRLPAAVVAETFAVWRAALRASRGTTREVRLGQQKSRARQAVGVILLAAAPGTVVIDVDREANVVLVHGLDDPEGAMERAVRS